MTEAYGTFRCAALIACLVGAIPAAQAADCQLKQYASIEMKVSPDSILLPVKLGDVQKEFSFQPGNALSGISENLATELDLRIHSVDPNVFIERGATKITKLTTVPHFIVGGIDFKGMEFLVLPPAANPEGYSGDIGIRPFSKTDIELDMAQGKLNLFSQDHCPGNVVYWTKAGFAQLPFLWQEAGYIRPEMQLDGHTVRVALTGRGRSLIGMNKMRLLFGIDATSPDMTPAGVDPSGRKIFRYPFKNLVAGGLSVSNPAITVIDEPPETGCIYPLHWEYPNPLPLHSTEQPRLASCSGGGDIALGLSVLSKLHIYASLKEKILYLTPAETR